APTSSSGLLPGWPSKRLPAVNPASGACAPFIVPLPSLNPPVQVADALLIAIGSSPFSGSRKSGCRKGANLSTDGPERKRKPAPVTVHRGREKSTEAVRKASPYRTFLGEYFGHARSAPPRPHGFRLPRPRHRRRRGVLTCLGGLEEVAGEEAPQGPQG